MTVNNRSFRPSSLVLVCAERRKTPKGENHLNNNTAAGVEVDKRRAPMPPYPIRLHSRYRLKSKKYIMVHQWTHIIVMIIIIIILYNEHVHMMGERRVVY